MARARLLMRGHRGELDYRSTSY